MDFLSTIYRVRIDFSMPDMSTAQECAFWDAVYKMPSAVKSDKLCSCPMNMYIEAEFTKTSNAIAFQGDLLAFLDTEKCTIVL